MSYSAVDTESTVISASLGALRTQNQSHNRVLDVTVRVGSAKFDNYHLIGGDRAQFTSASLLPIEDSDPAIRQRVWSETDRVYRLGAQRLTNLKTSKELNVASEDQSDDFSSAEAVTDQQPPKTRKVNSEEWAKRTRRWSTELGQYPGILASSVTVVLQRESKYLVNSDGTRLLHGRGFARIMITAQGKAGDGMDLATMDSFEAEDPADLPDDERVLAAVRRVGANLNALLNAPLVDPIVAPAILSGRASGVFFHEIFGHRVEGHRQKDETEGQTFTKSVGEPSIAGFSLGGLRPHPATHRRRRSQRTGIATTTKAYGHAPSWWWRTVFSRRS